jgi:hypothetical protein
MRVPTARSLTVPSDDPRRSKRRLAWFAGGCVALVCAWFAYVTFMSFGCTFPNDYQARVIRGAAQNWQLTQQPHGCPKFADLTRAGVLDTEFANSLSTRSVRIRCDGDDIEVRWAGEDEQFGTSDDQVAPTVRP